MRIADRLRRTLTQRRPPHLGAGIGVPDGAHHRKLVDPAMQHRMRLRPQCIAARGEIDRLNQWFGLHQVVQGITLRVQARIEPPLGEAVPDHIPAAPMPAYSSAASFTGTSIPVITPRTSFSHPVLATQSDVGLVKAA